jgi:hypothetical protein
VTQSVNDSWREPDTGYDFIVRVLMRGDTFYLHATYYEMFIICTQQ